MLIRSERTFVLAVVSSVGMKRPAIVIVNVHPFAVPDVMRVISGTGRPHCWGGEEGQFGRRVRGRGWGGVRGLGGGLG
jgi:hypothetical protein